MEVETKQDYDFKRKSEFVVPTNGVKLIMLKSSVNGFVQTGQYKLVQVPAKLIRKKSNPLRVATGVMLATESPTIKSANGAQEIERILW